MRCTASLFFLPRVTFIHYLPRRKGLCNEIQNKPRNMRVSCESWHREYWSASNFKGGGIFLQHRGIAASKINAWNFIRLLDMEELGDLEHHAEMPRKHSQPPTSCSSPRVLVENLPQSFVNIGGYHDEHQPVLDNLFSPKTSLFNEKLPPKWLSWTKINHLYTK